MPEYSRWRRHWAHPKRPCRTCGRETSGYPIQNGKDNGLLSTGKDLPVTPTFYRSDNR